MYNDVELKCFTRATTGLTKNILLSTGKWLRFERIFYIVNSNWYLFFGINVLNSCLAIFVAGRNDVLSLQFAGKLFQFLWIVNTLLVPTVLKWCGNKLQDIVPCRLNCLATEWSSIARYKPSVQQVGTSWDGSFFSA